MLYLWNGGPQDCDEEYNWHIGEPKPSFVRSSVMTFQASGDELSLILRAIDEKSAAVPLEGRAVWEPGNYRGMSHIGAIKALRNAVPTISLFAAKQVVDGWMKNGSFAPSNSPVCQSCKKTL